MDEKLVVSMKFGSHLYGTDTPESDLDYKGVYLPSARDILLQRVRGSINTQRPKSDGEKNVAGEVDDERYSLQRYLSLLSEGQTVSIDMLFAPDSMLIESSDIWEQIRENKQRLLTKRSAAFVGYCRTQANKYGIKGSRVAAARNASEFFARELAARGSQTKVAEVAEALRAICDEHSGIVELPTIKEKTEWFFECCNRKVNFGATIKQAHEIFTRIYENYGKRAQLAEANEGVDWKALSHAVRVGREAIELLQSGNITFPLADAAHILDIKKGRLSYETVASEIEKLLEEVEAASVRSLLPDSADATFIDDFVEEIYGAVVRELPPAVIGSDTTSDPATARKE